MIGESRSYGCGPHRSTTCRGARVARQRCPILRAGETNFIHLRVEFTTIFHLDFWLDATIPVSFRFLRDATRAYDFRTNDREGWIAGSGVIYEVGARLSPRRRPARIVLFRPAKTRR